MSNFLTIYLKTTGEPFDVPYQLQTTVNDLIKYVCAHHTRLLNDNPDDYYLTINNKEMIDGNQTVKEAGLDQPDRCKSLHMCLETPVLAERIMRSHLQFWQASDKQVSKKTPQTKATKELTKSGMR